MGFFQGGKCSLFPVLSHREIQDEILAAGTGNLKDKSVFQTCCVGRGGRKVCGNVEVGQKK